jgi:hypothetical protein
MDNEFTNNCAQCGAPYIVVRRTHRFCSVPCRYTWHNLHSNKPELLRETRAKQRIRDMQKTTWE